MNSWQRGRCSFPFQRLRAPFAPWQTLLGGELLTQGSQSPPGSPSDLLNSSKTRTESTDWAPARAGPPSAPPWDRWHKPQCRAQLLHLWVQKHGVCNGILIVLTLGALRARRSPRSVCAQSQRRHILHQSITPCPGDTTNHRCRLRSICECGNSQGVPVHISPRAIPVPPAQGDTAGAGAPRAAAVNG